MKFSTSFGLALLLPWLSGLLCAADAVRHTMLLIGGCDLEAGAVSVRLHHGGPQAAQPKAEVVADILAGIKERRA